MTAHHPPCKDEQLVGILAWHEVSFRGPDAAQACDLPESQQGHIEHVYKSRNVFPLTFTTIASTSPAALRVVGSAGPPPVKIPGAQKGPFRTPLRTSPASQLLEHCSGTGVALPLGASVDFTTAVTSRTTTLPVRPNQPSVSIMLKL
jgi:hypothetical protein